jgi:hypothetical protein
MNDHAFLLSLAQLMEDNPDGEWESDWKVALAAWHDAAEERGETPLAERLLLIARVPNQVDRSGCYSESGQSITHHCRWHFPSPDIGIWPKVDLVITTFPEPSDWKTGDWVTQPEVVVCSHCGAEFETERPEGPGEAHGEA